MKKRNKRFALRIDSELPVQISTIFLGQYSAGRGIVQELSRVGCRILGNDPVIVGEALNVRLSFSTSGKPLIIERAIVKWVKELEFGVVFHDLPQREADRLQHLLETLRGKGIYIGRAGPPAA